MPLHPRFPWKVNKGTEWSPAFGRKKKSFLILFTITVPFQGYLHKTLWQVWNILVHRMNRKLCSSWAFKQCLKHLKDNLAASLGKMNWYEYMLSYVSTKWALTSLKSGDFTDFLPLHLLIKPHLDRFLTISDRKIASNIFFVNSKRGEGGP